MARNDRSKRSREGSHDDKRSRVEQSQTPICPKCRSDELDRPGDTNASIWFICLRCKHVWRQSQTS